MPQKWVYCGAFYHCTHDHAAAAFEKNKIINPTVEYGLPDGMKTVNDVSFSG